MRIVFLRLFLIITLILGSARLSLSTSNQSPKDENPIDLIERFKYFNKTVSEDPQFKHQSFEKTAYIVDTFGPRLWGSDALNLALKSMYDIMVKDGFENVKLENVPNVTKWVRGKEYLKMLSPRKYPVKIPMIGLGVSVGGDVTADVIVVKNFDELAALSNDAVKGKIVLFNVKWVDYGTNVAYRSRGARVASKKGAVAVIIRSVTPISLETPHTGKVNYNTTEAPAIPACAISIEDAEMFQRMSDRKKKITVQLYMEGKIQPEKTNSYNLVGEIIGKDLPEEIILIGGHVDSWDAGPQTGANDDLSGFYVCYEAVRLLLKTENRPRRTIRVIAWSGEEMGFAEQGANRYVIDHAAELNKHVLAFESDQGVKKLQGFSFSGDRIGGAVIGYLSYLLEDIKIGKLEYDGVMVDTDPLYGKGVPAMKNLQSLTNDEAEYFKYHHSAADTMSVLNPDDMDSNVIGIASITFAVANLPAALPHHSDIEQ